MAHTDEYLDCVNNWWGGFVGKETCEAGYLVCKGKECDRYTPEKKQKKQTNADKIRQMSNEELARFLNSVETDGRLYGPRGYLPYWLDWMKQEVECDA